jgi:probable O-glycosylation ligase (exosortase A-associated)
VVEVKQTILMIVLTVAGTLGVFVGGPFIGLAIYYLFAVLRPQFLWQWALPPDIGWSSYVAAAAILGAIGQLALNSRGNDAGAVRRLAFGHAAYLAFGGWIIVTYFTATNREVAEPWLIEYLKILTMFGIGAIIVYRARQITILYLLATIALVYIAYEVNFLYLTERRLDIYRNGYGGLDNNGAGLMLAMGLPLTIYAWEAIKGWTRWIFAAGVPVLLHAVLMTYSRGAMVSLLAASPIILLRSRRRWQFLALAVMIASIVPILAGKEIRDRFFTLQKYSSDDSANSRFASWGAAIQIANEYPIFGAGLRNSNLLSYAFGADEEGRTIHSQYLQTLADMGYPGLALYLIAIGSAFTATIRSRRALRRRTDPEALRMRSMLSGIEGSLVVFCVGGAFLSIEVFELPYLLGLLAIQLWVLARSHDGVAAIAAAAAVAGSPIQQPSLPGARL